ncbi:MAG: hypothetical protein SVX43_02790 [Cyanobacteriota bacterium]|nr:hypothetical protein [Cyanobacteriota bacterium]
MNLLRGTFPDWTFVTAQQEIQGVFDIYTQKAIGITSSEAYQLAAPPGYRTGPYVGAELEFYYNPVGSDPSGSNVHWIQQVRSNHAVTKSYTGQVISEQHGQNQNKLDIVLEQTDPTFQDPLDPTKNTYNPYYDTFTIADSYYFYDAPGRPDITEEHSWKANLYLVEEIAPQTAKIYNGIFWGWSSDWSPTPTPPPPPPPPCNGGSGGGGCSAASLSNLTVRDSSSVPEPGLVFGLLALTVGGVLNYCFKHKQ